MLTALTNYPDKEVAAAAITAFNRHLWYLSEVLIVLAFFDEEVSTEEMKKMVEAFRQTPGSDKPLKRIPPITDPAVKSLHDFVTMSTARFFEALDLSSCFMDYDPTEWCDQEDYQRSKETVTSLKVVNDLAERGVVLVQEFNSSLTRNEEQRQFLLQTVKNHRDMFPVPQKAAAMQ